MSRKTFLKNINIVLCIIILLLFWVIYIRIEYFGKHDSGLENALLEAEKHQNSDVKSIMDELNRSKNNSSFPNENELIKTTTNITDELKFPDTSYGLIINN